MPVYNSGGREEVWEESEEEGELRYQTLEEEHQNIWINIPTNSDLMESAWVHYNEFIFSSLFSSLRCVWEDGVSLLREVS